MHPSTSPAGSVTILPVPTVGVVAAGDDLVDHLVRAVAAADVVLLDGDVVTVASKVVALAERAFEELPSAAAGEPRRAVATRLATRVVADDRRTLVVRTHHGFVCANAGLDASNVESGLLRLPDDPDASARRLRVRLRDRLDVDVGVVVTDTFGRPWRLGQTDVALGVAGTTALRDDRGTTDLHGRRLDVTMVAVADEVAGAADLVRRKADGVPFVVVRGLRPGRHGLGADLVRPLEDDLFPAGGPTLAEHAVRTTTGVAQPPATAGAPTPRQALVRAARAAERPGATVTVEQGAAAATIEADDAVAAGMVAEALRIVLAGRGLSLQVGEPRRHAGRVGLEVTVVAVAGSPARHG